MCTVVYSTFRLMRIFKLMRFLPSLQRQMVVIVASLGEVSNFCLILFLFMFIEAVCIASSFDTE